MPKTLHTEALILAGGASRRMGEDKANLVFNNMPLHEWMQIALRAAGVQRIWLSGANVPNGIPDLLPGQGPLSGIFATLSAMTTLPDRLIIVPIDMPNLISNDYLTLINAAESAPCINYRESHFPLILAPTSSLISHLSHLLKPTGDAKNPKASMKALFGFYGNSQQNLDIIAPERFINTNTPEEWQTCIQNKGQP